MKSSIGGILVSVTLMGSLTACSLLPSSSEPRLGAARASYENGTSLIVDGVLFDSEQTSLKPGAREIISKTVDYLRDNPYSQVVVEGHTDHLGPARYNQKLSEKRAGAIVNALEARGISPDRITAIGYGETKPVADNKTAHGRRANRRVEIILQNDF
ncbi:MAG: OmpA family protein [Pseudomonadota bacterium]